MERYCASSIPYLSVHLPPLLDIYKYIDTLPACVVRLEILSEEGQKEEKEGEEAIWRGPV